MPRREKTIEKYAAVTDRANVLLKEGRSIKEIFEILGREFYLSGHSLRKILYLKRRTPSEIVLTRAVAKLYQKGLTTPEVMAALKKKYGLAASTIRNKVKIQKIKEQVYGNIGRTPLNR